MNILQTGDLTSKSTKILNEQVWEDSMKRSMEKIEMCCCSPPSAGTSPLPSSVNDRILSESGSVFLFVHSL